MTPQGHLGHHPASPAMRTLTAVLSGPSPVSLLVFLFQLMRSLGEMLHLVQCP